jgi:NAD(P)-dependent dehydrogenase (short-subunit alcohol dehydrogenase family)
MLTTLPRHVAMTEAVLITGASSGVGEAAARYFSYRGWNVVATSRTVSKLSSVEDAQTATLRLDVTDEESIAAAVAETTRRFGGIDVLINNAGVDLAGPIEAITPELIQRVFATNLFGAVAITRAVTANAGTSRGPL